MSNNKINQTTATSFFERVGVKKETIQVGAGIPFGFERISNPNLGIGGVYGEEASIMTS